MLLLGMMCLLAFNSQANAPVATKVELKTTRFSDGESQTFTHQVFSHEGKIVTVNTTSDSELSNRLLSDVGSNNVYFNDAQENKCQQLAGDQFSQYLGQYIAKLTDNFSVDISKPSFVKRYEKAADPIAGYEVTETGWQLKVSIKFPLLFKKTQWDVTRDLTLWQTQAQLPKNMVPVEPGWLNTGFDVIDNLVNEVLETVPGYTMKSDMKQTIVSNLTTPPELRVIQSVTLLDTQYKQTPMMYFERPACAPVEKKALKNASEQALWLLYGKLLKE